MNNKIEPHYVNFNIAKWLKEKGFDEPCYRTYNHEQKLSPFPIIENMGGERVDPLDYKWNNSTIHPSNITAPEQWMVVEWLRVNYRINVEANYLSNIAKYRWLAKPMNIIPKNFKTSKEYSLAVDKYYGKENFDSPQEAYSAAFDYIKDNNLI